MKPKNVKIFDSVKMVREIRNAISKKAQDPYFDPKEFDRIKAKWTKLLERQEKISGNLIDA